MAVSQKRLLHVGSALKRTLHEAKEGARGRAVTVAEREAIDRCDRLNIGAFHLRIAKVAKQFREKHGQDTHGAVDARGGAEERDIRPAVSHAQAHSGKPRTSLRSHTHSLKCIKSGTGRLLCNYA